MGYSAITNTDFFAEISSASYLLFLFTKITSIFFYSEWGWMGSVVGMKILFSSKLDLSGLVTTLSVWEFSAPGSQLSLHVCQRVHRGRAIVINHTVSYPCANKMYGVCFIHRVLTSVGDTEEDTLCNGISALMVFCKAQELKTKGWSTRCLFWQSRMVLLNGLKFRVTIQDLSPDSLS